MSRPTSDPSPHDAEAREIAHSIASGGTKPRLRRAPWVIAAIAVACCSLVYNTLSPAQKALVEALPVIQKFVWVAVLLVGVFVTASMIITSYHFLAGVVGRYRAAPILARALLRSIESYERVTATPKRRRNRAPSTQAQLAKIGYAVLQRAASRGTQMQLTDGASTESEHDEPAAPGRPDYPEEGAPPND